MAYHIQNSGHSIDKRSLKIVFHMLGMELLEAYESLEVIRGDNLIINDSGQSPSVVHNRKAGLL